MKILVKIDICISKDTYLSKLNVAMF